MNDDTADYPPAYIEIPVWFLVDAAGRAVADVNRDHLAGEWDADHGRFDPEMPSAIGRAVLRVKLPAAVELGEVNVLCLG